MWQFIRFVLNKQLIKIQVDLDLFTKCTFLKNTQQKIRDFDHVAYYNEQKADHRRNFKPSISFIRA